MGTKPPFLLAFLLDLWRRRPLWVVLGLAAVARVAYLWTYAAEQPFWNAPIADAEVYHELASALAEGTFFAPETTYRPFLYPLWLGAVYALGGAQPWLAYGLQALLGLGTIACVYSAGRRAGDETTGLLAAVLVALYGPLLAAESKLLDGALTVALHASALAALLACRRARGWLGTGVLLGLGAVARPPLLLFAALALGWLARRWGRRALVWGSLGVMLPLAGAAGWNQASTGSPSPLSRNGAVTFYTGNHGSARGDYQVPPGLSGEARTQEAEESRLGASGYALGLYWMAEHPASAARLWVQKLWRFAMADEAPLEHDYAFERDAVPVLHALFVPFSLLFVLSLVALGARPWGPAVGLWGGALLVHLATALVFYVSGRYRLVALPACALLAATALRLGARRWREGPWPRGFVVAFAVVGLVVGLGFNPLDEPAQRRAIAEFNAGYANAKQGDLHRAVLRYQTALAAWPPMLEARFELGNVAARAGAHAQARQHYADVLRRRPDHVLAHLNLGITLLRTTPPEVARAREHLERARALAPELADAESQLGHASIAVDDWPGAAAHFEAAARRAPRSAAAWLNLGTARWRALTPEARRDGARVLEVVRDFERALGLGSTQAARALVDLAAVLSHPSR